MKDFHKFLMLMKELECATVRTSPPMFNSIFSHVTTIDSGNLSGSSLQNIANTDARQHGPLILYKSFDEDLFVVRNFPASKGCLTIQNQPWLPELKEILIFLLN